MIKIVHILSLMNFGGMEQLVFNLCKYTKNTKPSVLAIRDGVIVEDFQKVNMSIFVMPTIDNPYERYQKALEILREADIINVHCLYRDPILGLFVWFVKESGVPYLFTLHWQSRLPLLDCVICCTAQCIKAMQAKGNKCGVVPTLWRSRNFGRSIKFSYRERRISDSTRTERVRESKKVRYC